MPACLPTYLPLFLCLLSCRFQVTVMLRIIEDEARGSNWSLLMLSSLWSLLLQSQLPIGAHVKPLRLWVFHNWAFHGLFLFLYYSFFLKMGHHRPLFLLFSPFQYTVDRKQMFNINKLFFADDWIRTSGIGSDRSTN